MTFKLKRPKRRVNEKMTLESLYKSAETYREMYDDICKKKAILQKQLEIAVNGLKYYGNEDKWTNCHSNWADCDTLSCLCDYGYKFAQETLQQIKELDK